MAMIRSRLGTGVVHHLERLFGHGTVTGLTEGQLLDRFASRRDESAFELLMEAPRAHGSERLPAVSARSQRC